MGPEKSRKQTRASLRLPVAVELCSVTTKRIGWIQFLELSRGEDPDRVKLLSP